MCGIVGYLAFSVEQNVVPILMEGLKRLEYRGYDSAGVAVLTDDKIVLQKAVGKVKILADGVAESRLTGSCGIAHTRWATHGEPTHDNAHPHIDHYGNIAIVHNGIIENWPEINRSLREAGYFSLGEPKSSTDSEFIAHLIAREFTYCGNDFFRAFLKALKKLKGTYGVVVLTTLAGKGTRQLFAAAQGSPLCYGLCTDGIMIASDEAAIAGYTEKVVRLNYGDAVVFSPERDQPVNHIEANGDPVKRQETNIEATVEELQTGAYEHFMAKEIFEQPDSLRNACLGRLLIESGRIKLGGLINFEEKLKSVKRIMLSASGTSLNAAMIGQIMFESIGLPARAELASHFISRQPPLESDTLGIVISQSGETYDVIRALDYCQKADMPMLGIVNKVGSAIARQTDAGVYLHAGPEIGVASTKAFTAQVEVLALITVFVGQLGNRLSKRESARMVNAIAKLPGKVDKLLSSGISEQVLKKVRETENKVSFLFLGTGYQYAVALEGALKLKEVAYVPSDACETGQMKHGSIALVSDRLKVIMLATDDCFKGSVDNIRELLARKADILLIATEGNTEAIELVGEDNVIFVPATIPMLTPILSVIPLQLFAYHAAVVQGYDPDQPRNLAKAVTVP
ncbi:MAG: glutamine--fructose-6-phosphate transaminase (isomerizing) [Patescibacteria group bacterium]